jgi:hypothetical protein
VAVVVAFILGPIFIYKAYHFFPALEIVFGTQVQVANVKKPYLPVIYEFL